jgi:hypothetical protein
MVLVVERSEEGKAHGVQRLVYFLSEVLSPSKQCNPHYQKLAYSVFMIAQKLRHYFSAHPIVVVNEAPLSNILNNPEATGRVSLWGIELSPWTSHMRKLLELCPRGNNKDVIIIILVHDNVYIPC